MNAAPHKQTPHAAQQQFLLRALFGSLVFWAALAAPGVRAQTAAPEAQNGPQEAASEKLPAPALRPFKDLLAEVARLRADGSLVPEETFDFTVEADRNENGTLSNVVMVVASASNDRLPRLFQDFLAALSDSRALAALPADARRLSLRLRLDSQTALATLSHDAESEARAATLTRGYDGLLFIGRAAKKGRPEQIVWDNTRVTANGKQLTATLEMPREQLGNLLRQSLALP